MLFLSVQAQLLSVDMECAVAITSFGEPECQTTEETSSSLETTIIIVLGVLLILLAFRCNCGSDCCGASEEIKEG